MLDPPTHPPLNQTLHQPPTAFPAPLPFPSLTCTAMSSMSVLPYAVSRRRLAARACAVVVVEESATADATSVAW
jgi:hypothetical protein